MSDGDVSLIRDEDVLRRMWQQTEDFSRKKEIRAHMYRLREERLRNLYSPEPSLDAAKGCEFSSTQGHVKSFADQNFQSMKSKEVRDAGSPPKEFNYRGQDLKDLSNAGWNVESENRTTDDGHTRVKSVHANIEGRYDVDGGKGHFIAADHQKQAVTEYNDGNTNLKRNEDYSNTSAHEQVVRQTGDGTHFSSTSSSSTSASKFEQITSSKESVQYPTKDSYGYSEALYDDNRNEEFTRKETKTSNYNQISSNDFEQGELLSRKIDYPDDNTKIIVETRCLPDGTKVTSTRREFRAPSVQTRRSEHHSEQIKSESKSSSYTSSQKRTHSNELTSKVTQKDSHNVQDIVDSQRAKDSFDFKRENEYAESRTSDIHYENTKRSANDDQQSDITDFYDNKCFRKQDILEKTVCYNREDSRSNETHVQDINRKELKWNDYGTSNDNKKQIIEDESSRAKFDDVKATQKESSLREPLNPADTNIYRKCNETPTDIMVTNIKNKEDTHIFNTSGEFVHNITKESELTDNIETSSSHHYKTTYQSDYTRRKISSDLSPTHQAWASTLRSETPPRSTARAPSPGNKTYKSSTSSLRSSVSPDKIYRKPSSRGGSPKKVNRDSPTRSSPDNTSFSSQLHFNETIESNKISDRIETRRQKSPTRNLSSPERKPISGDVKRSSLSPDKQPKTLRTQTSPQRKSGNQSSSGRESPLTGRPVPTRNTPSPERNYRSMDKHTTTQTQIDSKRENISTKSISKHTEKNCEDEEIINIERSPDSERPDNQPNYMKPTVSSSPKGNRASSPIKQINSDRKPSVNHLPSQSVERQINSVKNKHDNFITEEHNNYSSINENITSHVDSELNVIDRQDVPETVITKNKPEYNEREPLSNIKTTIATRPDEQPSYMKPTVSKLTKTSRESSPTKQKPNEQNVPLNQMSSQNLEKQINTLKSEQDKFITEEQKIYNITQENVTSNVHVKCDEIQNIISKESVIKTFSENNDQSETLIKNKTEAAEHTDNHQKYIKPKVFDSPKNSRASSPTKQKPSDQKSPINKAPHNLDSEFDNPQEKYKESPRLSPERGNKQHAELEDDNKILSHSHFPQKTANNKSIENREQYIEDSIATQKKYKTEKQEEVKEKLKQPSRETSPAKKRESPDKTTLKTYKVKPTTEKRSPSPTKETSVSSSLQTENEEIQKMVKTSVKNDKNYNYIDSNVQSERSTTKVSPRRSISPTKPSLDSKRKQTLDFIATEINNEKSNNTFAKQPRTLHTPSTSPSRKPKSDDTAPSTGQSSPTTESGFIYISSKIEDDTTTDIVKTETETAESIPKHKFEKSPNDSYRKEHPRSPSPTKIPCRSPSPEKHINKENLPRKSSLKKTSFDNGNVTPSPKPPTSFLISPNDEEKEVLKETPVKISDKPIKPKPPLERRETYEERCRKILGMTDDNHNTDSAQQTVQAKSRDTISPSESPTHVSEKIVSSDDYGLVNVVDLTATTVDKALNTSQSQTKDTQISNETKYKKQEKTTIKSVITDDSHTFLQEPDIQTENKKNKELNINLIKNETISNEKYLDTRSSKKEQLLSKSNGDKVYEDSQNQLCEDINIQEQVSQFISSQKEQEILDRVQSSLRKLSPDRKGKPVEDVPNKKSNSKLPILNDKNTREDCINQASDEIKNNIFIHSEDKFISNTTVIDEKSAPKKQTSNKPSSRNTSPTKKTQTSQTLSKMNSETVNRRSISPKKPLSPIEKKHPSSIERPHSPLGPKSTIKTSSSTKSDRTDIKKSTTKTASTRTSPTKVNASKLVFANNNKLQEIESKPQQKSPQTPIFKKEPDSKVVRTSSDINIKSTSKKVSPQRMKSKPEIQVNNITTNKMYKRNTNSPTTKTHRSFIKDVPTKLPVNKPKSATALNTSMGDNDDIIIDVQQAKSSRENSPDRICPTPVGFSVDTGTPRFPDEVNEPDDEIGKRSHNIIHETETLVDDIVEICEEDEISVQNIENYKVQHKPITTDKLPKPSTVNSSKNNLSISMKTQDRSDVSKEENLKSDECLLSVSEKVNRFAKGSVISKDKSPSRNIKEEYDRETIYTDDYSKLSVNDKAHLFIETAENIKITKPKSVQKPLRPDLTNVDESLKSDECLLSVSDKVNKFVKTAEHVSTDKYVINEKDLKIQKEHDKIIQQIVDNSGDNLIEPENISTPSIISEVVDDVKPQSIRTPKNDISKTTGSNDSKSLIKQSDKHKTVKVTTLRSSEAVKKAKALFENIASTTKTKETAIRNRTTKLTDIGVSQKVPQSETKQPAQVQRPMIEETDYDEEQTPLSSLPRQNTTDKNPRSNSETKKDTNSIHRATSPQQRNSTPTKRPMSPYTNDNTPPIREKSPLPKSPFTRDKSPNTRVKSPMLREESPISNIRSPHSQTATIVPKKVLSRLPVTEQVDSIKQFPIENKEETSVDKIPGYQRPTKTSQLKEEKMVEETEVSNRRGSGKFGVELRRTSADRSSVSSERRRSSAEHHQPCIEDIFDLNLLEQMLEKVVGYEQRRRIRAQIRVAKKKLESEESTKVIKNLRQSTTKVVTSKSPERSVHRSPERSIKKARSPEEQLNIVPNRTSSPDRQDPPDCHQLNSTSITKEHEEIQTQSKLINSERKETNKTRGIRTQSPEKHIRTTPKTTHPSSSDKKRPVSPTKLSPKPKGNRFSEYASAYMKKVGLHEADKSKHKAHVIDEDRGKKAETTQKIEIQQVTTSIDHTSSKDTIEVRMERQKSPTPRRSLDHSPDPTQLQRKPSPERKAVQNSADSAVQNTNRATSPNRTFNSEVKTNKKETKSTFDIEKKIAQKQIQEEKPIWVTSRNLKKVTSESRTYSNKKIEVEKPKYRPSSPSKTITKPIDVITSSYGPGPLDADGRPLFGIKALRNGATNYQVKGTVIRQEYHSRNGGEPEGTVSVTAYSTEPEDLEKLLQTQGEKPSRLHGLAAITTTKKFGGDTGTTFNEIATKEERAALEQFTQSDRRVIESHTETRADSPERRVPREKIERAANKTETKGQTQKRTNQTLQSSLKKATTKDSDIKESRSDRMQRMERRVEDRKTVRQSSVKSLTEKFIKNASETSKTERTVYPKAGLILRTAGMKDSVSSDSSAHAGLARTDSEHSLASVDDMTTTTTTTTEQVGDVLRTTTTVTKTGGRTQERSFLDSSTKVTGVQDILTRMKNADIVIEEGDTNEDSEARALLNKFLGATVLMAGMKNYVTESSPASQERLKSSSAVEKSGARQTEVDIEQCWDERVLRKLLDECTDYDLRRRLRARIRALMAEQEACASAVTEALAAAGENVESAETEERQEIGERGESLLLPLLQGLLQGGGEKLLAGLGAASHDVVADVRRSLRRLRLALAPPADHPQARALLALADRLEDALDEADRLDGCRRKPRRRSRAARHTVGVTREELEEARRLVDRDTLLPHDGPVAPNNTTSPSERKGSIDEDGSYFEPVEAKQKPMPVAHSASYESAPKVNRDAQVVERRPSASRRPEFFRHSIADSIATEAPRIAAERWKVESKGGIAAIANKFDTKIEPEKSLLTKHAPASKPQITLQQKAGEESRRSYYRPPPPTYNFAAPQSDDLSKPLNRSSNAAKRLRMKRANTIDIGRPFGGYTFDSNIQNDIRRTPAAAEFRTETENDKKFLAFIQKNEENGRTHGVGHTNWSSRFGNIKNAFENREKEEHSRSSSTSSAKRFWQAADSSNGITLRPKKFLNANETVPDIVKPPWVSQRRESLKSHVLPLSKQVPQQSINPPLILAPAKPCTVKPFAAKPLPVNQFSHAPMSAFKPPQKVASPTRAPPNIWSPPSSSIPISPSAENSLRYPSTRHSYDNSTSATGTYLVSDTEKQRQIASNYEHNKLNHASIPKSYDCPATPPTHAQHQQNYPITAIPSQNSLAAPELVKRINSTNWNRSPDDFTNKIDAQQLQIEFYEKQILEKSKRDASSERRDILTHKPPTLPTTPSNTAYTVVDYTPVNSSSFIPLQQTPDIEKAKAHKVDYLPDVVINENNSTNYLHSPITRVTPVSSPGIKHLHNGDVRVNGDDTATEHESVVTKVMRGPVRGSATITTGVRTRGAADNLRGVLDKLSSPKHEVISQIEKKKRENSLARFAPPPLPVLSPSHATSPIRPQETYVLSGSRSPALAASRESMLSSESPGSRGSSPGSALTRSGSWNRLSEYSPKLTSPRKVVARTKSMHLLAVPKLYEGGISQDEYIEKKRTVEAYFSGQTSPSRSQQSKGARSPSTQFALGRSRTMPAVSELQFLDESNADDAFEDLVSGLA